MPDEVECALECECGGSVSCVLFFTGGEETVSMTDVPCDSCERTYTIALYNGSYRPPEAETEPYHYEPIKFEFVGVSQTALKATIHNV